MPYRRSTKARKRGPRKMGWAPAVLAVAKANEAEAKKLRAKADRLTKGARYLRKTVEDLQALDQ